MFSVILEEIQRTSCQPREVCVEVAKEYPESTSQFYLPRCVALHRCGGCCTNEAFYCTNTSHTLVNKTVSDPAGFSFFFTLLFTLYSTWIIERSSPLHHCVGIFCSYTSNCLRKQDINPVTVCNKLIWITTHPAAMGLLLAATGHQVNTGSCTVVQPCNSYINLHMSAKILITSNTVPW